MTQNRLPSPSAGRREQGDHADSRWADLADLALVIAREIQIRGYTDERAQPLSASEGMVMRYLQTDSGAPPGRIADATGIQRNNLSPVLRTLEAKGLIERRILPEDRRGVTVHATDLGRTNYTVVRQEWADAVATAAGYDTRNLDATLSLLAAVQAGLVKTRAGDQAS